MSEEYFSQEWLRKRIINYSYNLYKSLLKIWGYKSNSSIIFFYNEKIWGKLLFLVHDVRYKWKKSLIWMIFVEIDMKEVSCILKCHFACHYVYFYTSINYKYSTVFKWFILMVKSIFKYSVPNRKFRSYASIYNGRSTAPVMETHCWLTNAGIVLAIIQAKHYANVGIPVAAWQRWLNTGITPAQCR